METAKENGGKSKGGRTAIDAAVQVAAHLVAEHEGAEHLPILIVKQGPKVRYEVTTSFQAE